MNRKIPFTDKKIAQVLVVILSLVVVLLSLIGDKGMLALDQLRFAEGTLQQEIEGLKKEKREWYGKITSLENNQTYVETFARERLGLIRKDEFVILPPKAELPPFHVEGNSSVKPPVASP